MVRSAASDSITALTELILAVFRLNGALLESGDRLVAHLPLTSARWQVLGAIDTSPAPLPIAHVARNMGLSRQAVQRIANEMERDGLVTFEENPHHARARLVVMTRRGREVYAAAMALQKTWAGELAKGLAPAELEAARALLAGFHTRLDRKRLER